MSSLKARETTWRQELSQVHLPPQFHATSKSSFSHLTPRVSQYNGLERRNVLEDHEARIKKDSFRERGTQKDLEGEEGTSHEGTEDPIEA